MIRDEIRRAWYESPAKVIAAVVATLLAIPLIYILYVSWVFILEALGIPR